MQNPTAGESCSESVHLQGAPHSALNELRKEFSVKFDKLERLLLLLVSLVVILVLSVIIAVILFNFRSRMPSSDQVLLQAECVRTPPLLTNLEPQPAPIQVKLIVQRANSSASGSRLPTGETRSSLVHFLEANSRLRVLETEVDHNTPTIFASMAASNRFNENMLDWKQVDQAGRIDSFLLVWITSKDHCQDDPVHRKIRDFMQDRPNGNSKSPIVFLCWFDTFLAKDFNNASLVFLEREMQKHTTDSSFNAVKVRSSLDFITKTFWK